MIGGVGEGMFELGIAEDGALRRGYGGDAANTAVMAARLGHPARVCSRVGADSLGRSLVEFWEENGVDTRWVITDGDEPTAIYVNDCGRIDYHRRASAGSRLEPGDISDSFLAGLDAVHSTGVTLAISSTAEAALLDSFARARARGVSTSFAVNHRPALGGDPAVLLEVARAADVLFISADEARVLLGTDVPDEIFRALAARGEVVVTLGATGAVCSTGAAAEAPAVESVDTVGAGDALAGAYLASRLETHDPQAALERAVLAASLSCRDYGCALSYPHAAELARA